VQASGEIVEQAATIVSQRATQAQRECVEAQIRAEPIGMRHARGKSLLAGHNEKRAQSDKDDTEQQERDAIYQRNTSETAGHNEMRRNLNIDFQTSCFFLFIMAY